MSLLEHTIRPYALQSHTSTIAIAPMKSLLSSFALSPLSYGIQALVYRFLQERWVMKMGRWDLKLKLTPQWELSLPARETEAFTRLFSYTFLPTIEEIRRQYKHYTTFAEYFGFFPTLKEKARLAMRKDIMSDIVTKQYALRNSLAHSVDEVEEYYKMTIPQSIRRLLSSRIRFYNFLPREYILVGNSLQEQYQDRLTYFIFQQFVEGETLHDTSKHTLPASIKKQFIVFCYLLLLMHARLQLIPDTRPRHIMSQADDWLWKTDNIIVGRKGLKFVDTRWLWNTNGNFVQRGLFIPEKTIEKTRESLLNLCAYA